MADERDEEDASDLEYRKDSPDDEIVESTSDVEDSSKDEVEDDNAGKFETNVLPATKEFLLPNRTLPAVFESLDCSVEADRKDDHVDDDGFLLLSRLGVV